MKCFVAILWLLTLGCWGLMLLKTHGSPDEVPTWLSVGLNDRVDHFLAFGFLGGILSLSIWALLPKRPLLLSLALPALLAYAAIDEATRTDTSFRMQERHWLADAAGAGIAVTLMYLLCGLSRVLRRSTPAGIAPGGGGTSASRRASDLGSEVEAALASYNEADAEVGERIIRVEKTIGGLPGPNPVRARARRLR